MGSKVDLLDEIYSRLNTAIGVSGALYGVKRIRVGSTEEARKDNDLPIINVSLESGEELANYPNRMAFDDMVFEISIITPKLSSGTNLLYNTSNGTGALYLLEKTLNVIDKNTSGVVDNTFGGDAGYLASYSYRVQESGSNFVIIITARIKTKSFLIGSR